MWVLCVALYNTLLLIATACLLAIPAILRPGRVWLNGRSKLSNGTMAGYTTWFTDTQRGEIPAGGPVCFELIVHVYLVCKTTTAGRLLSQESSTNCPKQLCQCIHSVCCWALLSDRPNHSYSAGLDWVRQWEPDEPRTGGRCSCFSMLFFCTYTLQGVRKHSKLTDRQRELQYV